MPMKPLRPCAHHGCNQLVTSGYCDAHKKQVKKQYDDKRLSASERGYDTQWQRFREIYMRGHPLCVMCESKGYIVKADLIHHEKPLNEGGDKYADDNLMSLCNDCHESIHGKDRFKRRSNMA